MEGKNGEDYLAPEEGKDQVGDDINGSIKQAKEKHKNGKKKIRHDGQHAARHC